MNNQEINLLISKVPIVLQDELNYEIKKTVFSKSSLLMKFSEKFLKQIAGIMIEVRYSPDETIIAPSVMDDNALYLISKGEAAVIFRDTILAKLKVFLYGQIDFNLLERIKFWRIWLFYGIR